MKTIGIVTKHKLYHYGSILQAFALQVKLKEIGYDSEIIDYLYPNEYHNSLNKLRTTCENIKSYRKKIFHKILHLIYNKKDQNNINIRKIRFDEFTKNNLNLTTVLYKNKEDLIANPPNYDVYLTGSDQVWNSYFLYEDTTYLLSFAPQGKKKIAYAASFGQNKFDPDYAALYEKYLKQYDAISVRENSGISLVKELTGFNARLVLDPTLLLNKEDWIFYQSERLIDEPYILCYFLDYSFNPYPYLYDLSNSLHKETGFKLIQIDKNRYITPLNFPSKSICNAGPKEFISLIQNASLIITTSFHGTAFAINFNIPLFSIISNTPSSSDCRQKELLNSLDLERQLLVLNSSIPKFKQSLYSISDVNKKLDVLRNDSLNFLLNSL